MPRRGSDRAAARATTAADGSPAPKPIAARRKLTTILSADVKAFSRLMEADEEGTLETLKSYRAALDALIAGHDGRVVGTAGDSVLAEFASPVEAARCAAEIQDELARRNADLAEDRRLEFRIGINLGDVIVEGTDLFGDGVNIAARLQALADPGGILVSGGVYDQIKTKLALDYDFLGTRQVKNIAEPVRVYRVDRDPAVARQRWAARSRRRWGLNVLVSALILVGGLGVWQGLPLLVTMIEPLIGASSTPAVSDRASIAVLPFANQSGRDDDYFSDGLSEDLISALGRFSSLSVMSWNAVAPRKDQARRPEQLAQDLGVRYVVDGSVRLAGERLRVTARLTDAERGTLLWSERYDRALDDLFAVQDDITRHIVATLAIRVTDLEQQRAFAKPTESLSAYDYFLRGRQHYRPFTRTGNLRAQEMFETAIDLDPTYADAYAMLAWTHLKRAELGWAEWPHKALETAFELAQTALRLEPSNIRAQAMLATVYVYHHQDYEEALRAIHRVNELNPSYAENHSDRGWVLLVAGRTEEAIEVLEEVMRFDANPVPSVYSSLALAYCLQGRYEDAVATLQGVIARQPHHIQSHVALAAAYAGAGRLDEAARMAADVRRLHPFFEVDLFGEAFRDPADREHLRDWLRKAGL
jgi:adenylate cyclase